MKNDERGGYGAGKKDGFGLTAKPECRDVRAPVKFSERNPEDDYYVVRNRGIYQIGGIRRARTGIWAVPDVGRTGDVRADRGRARMA